MYLFLLRYSLLIISAQWAYSNNPTDKNGNNDGINLLQNLLIDNTFWQFMNNNNESMEVNKIKIIIHTNY